jgi:hypothetical protein
MSFSFTEQVLELHMVEAFGPDKIYILGNNTHHTFVESQEGILHTDFLDAVCRKTS